MRDIKFRVWSTIEAPRMIELKTGLIEVDLVNSPKWKVMQFTGLLDKNGKEIYEGDIIMTPEYEDRDGTIWEKEVGPIYWEDGGCRFTSNVGGQFIPNTSCEIIGNIYENPELLKRHC